jgi:protease-4
MMNKKKEGNQISIKKWVSRFFIMIGVLVTILACVIYWTANKYIYKKTHLVNPTIITMTVGGNYEMPDCNDDISILRRFRNKDLSLDETLKIIDEANRNPNVHGMLIHVAGGGIGLAQAQEIRSHLLKFKNSGKYIEAFTDTFGEGNNGTISYMLASVASKITMQPGGQVSLMGFATEHSFFAELFEKWNVKVRIARREEYKSFPEKFTERAYTQPFKESLNKILGGFKKQTMRSIEYDRKIPHDDLQECFAKSPLLASEAFQLKLIDSLDFYDSTLLKMKETLKKNKNVNVDFLSATTFLKHHIKRPKINKSCISVIFCEGEIYHDSPSDIDRISNEGIGGWSTADMIISASKDPVVKAIVIRINSGGGSSTASETLWGAIQAAKKIKPVIISLGNVAASGGYYMAVAADYIVCDPGTIVGSIGVFGGKFVTNQVWKYFGINHDGVKTDRHGLMNSSIFDYSEEEWGMLDKQVDSIYQSFINKVSKARHLSFEETHALAKGQVWTGEQALENHLVDELGGLETAIKRAKEKAKISLDTPVEIYEKPFSIIAQLLNVPMEEMKTKMIHMKNRFVNMSHRDLKSDLVIH